MNADDSVSTRLRRSANFAGCDLSKLKPKRNSTVKTSLKTLVYKRTHRGDPDDSGVFGVNDCMGEVRGWDFDAVIGVGGSHPDRGHECIARKVNWVGIGPHEVGATARGPCLGFDFFLPL